MLETSPWVSGMSVSEARGRLERVCKAISGAYAGKGFPYALEPGTDTRKDGRIVGNSGSAARAFLERGLGLQNYLSEKTFAKRGWNAVGFDKVLFPGKQ